MKSIIAVLCIVVLICALFSGCQELSDQAADLLNAKCDELINYFSEIAFYPSVGGKVIARWEEPIHIAVSGDYTNEDYSALTDFMDNLNKIDGMPDISIVDKDANCFVYFLPIDKMAENIPDYKNGNWWSYKVDWKLYKINKAYIGIVTDVSTQQERNYMILKTMSTIIGLFNTSDKYPDSIFYSEWMATQALSDMDYKLIGILYSPPFHAGMNEKEAQKALRPLVREKYVSLD